MKHSGRNYNSRHVSASSKHSFQRHSSSAKSILIALVLVSGTRLLDKSALATTVRLVPATALEQSGYVRSDCEALEPQSGSETGAQVVLSYCIQGSSLYGSTHGEEIGFEEAVHRVLASYQGRSVRRPELAAIRDEITLIYLQQGFLTSWAESVTIQPDGTLVVSVVEGFIQTVCALGAANSCRPFEGTPYARYVSAYLDDIIKQRPINIKELDRRLRRLASDERFQTEKALFRLQIPSESFFDRLVTDQPTEDGTEAPVAPELQWEELRRQLENYRTFVPEPGASILEIDLQFRPEVEDSEARSNNAPFVPTNRVLEERRRDAFREYFGSDVRRSVVDPLQDPLRDPVVDPSLIRYSLHSLEMQEPSIRAAVVYIASEGDRVFISIETSQSPTVEIETITRFEVNIDDEEFQRQTIELDGGSSDSEDRTSNPLAEILEFFGLRQGNRVTRDELALEVRNLWSEIQNPRSESYLRYSAELYSLLIRPVEEVLKDQGIEVNTLLFVMENGLGLLPVAALYDAESGQFLAEKYKIGIIPNFSSLDLRPSHLERADILAMGASEFQDSNLYPPLNAVPLELEMIKRIWPDDRTVTDSLNSQFTLERLRNARRNYPYQIVHLATHASFLPGKPGDSNIQLWDTSLPLQERQIASLNWNQPPLELLVLSACQTALGDESAELGFAGLSLQSNVKSTLASLWYVSDLASLIYMMEFYRSLSAGVTKVEAVQTAQLAMLDDQRLRQNLRELRRVINELLLDEPRLRRFTESELQGLRRLQEAVGKEQEVIENFSHPFYWSSYTLVGSPW
ncbi:CHAT domain-containing protein [Leptolyngbya sp. PCC 6406]|uniref:CHAT domain-containing protein n=1 Tax=Leptolyngbya sp. PCC 6406 TaxID=1173264 RepID=UPI0002AC3404|nr:CHAT domain-containing protein [Leptolyngbya sp. PCC 6406]